MTTLMPSALDAFVNPGSGDNLNTAGVVHHTQHSNLNDTVAQLEKITVGPAIFNIKGYGAKCDGVTLDDTAWTNAIAACQAAGGGTIWHPGGISLISTTINPTASNVHIEGHRSSVVKIQDGSGIMAIVFSYQTSPSSSHILQNVSIRGIEVNGNYTIHDTGTATGTQSTTLLTDSSKSWTSGQQTLFADGKHYVFFTGGNTGSGGPNGESALITAATATTLSFAARAFAPVTAQTTYSIVNQPPYSTHTGFAARGDMVGVYFEACQGVVAEDCFIHDTGNGALFAEMCTNVRFSSNRLDNTGLQQDTLAGRRGNALNIFGNGDSTVLPSNSVANGWGAGFVNNIITNNIITRITDVGIDYYPGGTAITVIANNILAYPSTSNAVVSLGAGNGIPGRVGIAFETPSNDVWPNGRTTISANIVTALSWGIELESNGTSEVTGCSVGDNFLYDLSGVGILWSGTDINVTGNTIWRYGLTNTGSGSAQGIYFLSSTTSNTHRGLTVTGNGIVAAGMDAPILNAPTASGSGSGLANSLYRYIVTAFNNCYLGANNKALPAGSIGETSQSLPVQITPTAGQNVNLSWPFLPTADGYRIYRTAAGGSAGTELLLDTVYGPDYLAAAGINYVDNGSKTPSGAMPTTNTSGVISTGIAFNKNAGETVQSILISGNSIVNTGVVDLQTDSATTSSSPIYVPVGFQDVSITSNQTYWGVSGIRADCDYVKISDNCVRNAQSVGINIGASVPRSVLNPSVSNNYVVDSNWAGHAGFGNAQIYYASTNGSYTDNICRNVVSGSSVYGYRSLQGTGSGNMIRGGDASGNVTAALACDNSARTGQVSYGATMGLGAGPELASVRGLNGIWTLTANKLNPAPSIPASTVASTIVPSDCHVYIAGGTVTVVSVGGQTTGITATAHSVRVQAGQTVTMTYSVAPTWTWFADA